MKHKLFFMTVSIGCVHFLWQSSPRILRMASILPEAISYLGQLCFCQRYLWYFWHQRLKAKQMKICGITFWKKPVDLSKIRLQQGLKIRSLWECGLCRHTIFNWVLKVLRYADYRNWKSRLWTNRRKKTLNSIGAIKNEYVLIKKKKILIGLFHSSPHFNIFWYRKDSIAMVAVFTKFDLKKLV